MDSDLYDAVTEDKLDALKEMVSKLKVGEQLTPTNQTVLHLACQYGSIKCVTEILSVHDSLLFKINSRGETALHLAAKQGHFVVVKALIDSAKSLVRRQDNVQDIAPSTVVQDLIRTPDEELETALHGAVRYNRKHVVELLVKEDPCHPHPLNKHNETPLYLASIRYYTDIMSTILDNCDWQKTGGDETTYLLAMFGGPEGRTALHAAVLDQGGYECVKLLLEKHEALVKVPDNYGWTAYHYVAYNNLDAILELLVAADKTKSVAYLEDREYKRTALHVVAYTGNLCVLERFVEYFPDSWEMIDGNGRNILHIAVEENRKKVIEFILSRGFKASNNLLTKRDCNGNTPLHLITKFGCYVPELMVGKAPKLEIDWEVLDSKNYTPLDRLHSDHETHTLSNQVKVRTSLIEAKVKKHWRLWRILKEPETESGKRVEKHTEKTNSSKVEEYRTMINSQMVVSALIATVAFSLLFNMPGGFDGNKGPKQGSPLLLRDKNFGNCIVFVAMALLLSVITLLLYFITTFNRDARTYAVLADYSDLAIPVCILTSFFLLCAIPVYIRLLRGKKPSTILLPTSTE
ncbi:hypothetical protein AgCh_000482 [Apium graveolens]